MIHLETEEEILFIKEDDLITSKKYGKKNFDYKFFEENYDLNGKIIEK